MIALLQRVIEAKVVVNNENIGEIKQGLLVFIGIEKNDDEKKGQRLLDKVLAYRVFADNEEKMNLSVEDIKGGLLLVPQFTLAANTQKGCRPSFSSAATPELGESLYDMFVSEAMEKYGNVATGQFAADMKVSLINDGPVTFWLQV